MNGLQKKRKMMKRKKEKKIQRSFVIMYIVSDTVSIKLQNELGSAKVSARRNYEEPLSTKPAPSLGPALIKPEVTSVPEASKHLNGSSSVLSSTGLLTKLGSPVNNEASFSDFSEKSSVSSPEETVVHHVQSSSSGSQGKNEVSGSSTSIEQKVIIHGEFADRDARILGTTEESSKSDFIDNLATKVTPSETKVKVGISPNLVATVESQANGKDDEKLPRLNKNDEEDPRTVDDLCVDLQEDKEEKEQQESEEEEQNSGKKKHSSENELVSKFTQDVTRKQVALRSDTLTFSKRVPEMQGSLETNHQLNHVKSVRLSSGRAKLGGLFDSNALMEKAKEIDVQDDSHKDPKGFASSESKERINNFSDGKDEVQSRIKLLEEELREAAAIEVGLYSVVAEHGSSTYKVHAPARRISRFYLHACRAETQAKRASAARAAASGLVLVSKACGNDVPRYVLNI